MQKGNFFFQGVDTSNKHVKNASKQVKKTILEIIKERKIKQPSYRGTEACYKGNTLLLQLDYMV